jgi:hypothetical protein
MPKALASIPLQTIRRWEYRMYRWMEAYRSGLGTKNAQIQVVDYVPTFKWSVFPRGIKILPYFHGAKSLHKISGL